MNMKADVRIDGLKRTSSKTVSWLIKYLRWTSGFLEVTISFSAAGLLSGTGGGGGI